MANNLIQIFMLLSYFKIQLLIANDDVIWDTIIADILVYVFAEEHGKFILRQSIPDE